MASSRLLTIGTTMPWAPLSSTRLMWSWRLARHAGQGDAAGVGDGREHVRGRLPIDEAVFDVHGQPGEAAAGEEARRGDAAERQPRPDGRAAGLQRLFDRIRSHEESSWRFRVQEGRQGDYTGRRETASDSARTSAAAAARGSAARQSASLTAARRAPAAAAAPTVSRLTPPIGKRRQRRLGRRRARNPDPPARQNASSATGTSGRRRDSSPRPAPLAAPARRCAC